MKSKPGLSGARGSPVRCGSRKIDIVVSGTTAVARQFAEAAPSALELGATPHQLAQRRLRRAQPFFAIAVSE
jgi:hypothetical protein